MTPQDYRRIVEGWAEVELNRRAQPRSNPKGFGPLTGDDPRRCPIVEWELVEPLVTRAPELRAVLLWWLDNGPLDPFDCAGYPFPRPGEADQLRRWALSPSSALRAFHERLGEAVAPRLDSLRLAWEEARLVVS